MTRVPSSLARWRPRPALFLSGDARGRGVACAALAAIVYLGCAAYALWPALATPRTHLPYAAANGGPSHGPTARLVEQDHKMVVATVARNASVLTSAPWQLFGDGQCYPLPRGYTLGEHMLGLGILAALPWAATHDPILSFNVALLLTLWIPALTMYALSLHFTRSAPAAFVAGLLFALLPKRLADPAHPFIHGDLWTPLALLLLHRLLTHGRWRDAIALAVTTSLVLCESIYPLAGLAILLAFLGPYLLVRHRARLVAVLPQLGFVTLVVLAVAWVIFGPYIETQRTWGLLGGRRPLLPDVSVYLPGQLGFPGWTVCALIVVALLDRLRGPLRVGGDDPRLAFLAGGVAIVALTIGTWHVPLLGLDLRSPLVLATRVVPGLDAVRGLPSIAIAAGLPFAFVAGYGVRALVARTRPAVAIALTAAIAVTVLAARFHPTLTRASFGPPTLRAEAFEVRPDAHDVAVTVARATGPVLDLPYAWRGAKRLAMADDLLRLSYAPQPTAACYNSFASPVQEQVGRLAAALPADAAADALAALGFTTVFLEQAQLLPAERKRFLAAVDAPDAAAPRLVEVAQTERLIAYRLSSPASVRDDFRALAVPVSPATGDTNAADAPLAVPWWVGAVTFNVRNRGDATFRHPEPLAPSDLVVRWSDASGLDVVHEQRLRALLPIALGARASTELNLALTRPPRPGPYQLRLVRATEPDVVLASRRVEVAPEPATAAASPGSALAGLRQGLPPARP